MNDSSEGPKDETARARMEAMLAAMGRRPAGDDDRLAAVVRRAMQRGAEETSDGERSCAVDAGGEEGLETREPGRSTPSTAEIRAVPGLGTRLGRYLPIEELGRGGMGRVLRAYDPKLQREVALKVLDTTAMESRGSARMAREARTMAKLNHPHVVSVYDVVEDSRHGLVIAMELVEGTTLQAWLRERSRSWREVLEAFIEAGRGLAAAHAQGLLHRDFKPANVLVALDGHEGDRGPVKVTDFGLAKRNHDAPTTAELPLAPVERPSRAAVGETLTEAGVLAGTPVYMAPEQHRGDALTSAADQYAFCVALWEAVYGERPFGGSTLESISANVLEGRRRPTPKGRTIPSRLRRVCERGLSLDPQHRWPSMDTLLTELHELVAPRTQRWVALGLTGGLAALGGALALGQYAEVMDRCTGARAQLEGIWDDARRQEVETAILGTHMVYATGTWERVEQRLDAYAEAWADEHTEVCKATSVRTEQSTAVMDLRMGCLRERRRALRAAVDVLASADGEVMENAVELAAGLPLLDRCDDVDLLEQQHQRIPPPEDPQVAQEVEVLRERLADIEAERAAGKYALALAQVEPVVQRAKALGHPPLLAEAMLERGSMLIELAKHTEAEQDLEAAYALALEIQHDDVALHSAQDLTFVVGNRQARYDEGLVWAQTAVPLAERRGEGVELASSLAQLGAVLDDQGEYEQAKLNHQRALQIWEKARGAGHPSVATSLNNLGIIFTKQGEYEQAKLHHQRALQMKEEALGPGHPSVAASLNNLGIAFGRQGDVEQAKLYHQRALEIREKALGTDHPDVAASLANLGNMLLIQGDYEQAKLHHQRALRIREKALGTDHPDVASSLTNLGVVFTMQGEYEQAKLHHQRALRIKEEALGLDHPDLAYSLNSLGDVLRSQGDYEEAELHHQRALRIWEKAMGPDHPNVANSANYVGFALLDRGEHAQAERYFQRALVIQEKALGADHPELAYSLLGLASIELVQQRLDSARAHAERAVSVFEAGTVAPKELAEARFVLAQALWSDRSQRTRSCALAQQARDVYVGLGDVQQQALAKVETWLAGHCVR